MPRRRPRIKYVSEGEDGVTREMVKVAEDRVRELVKHFGDTVLMTSIPDLAKNCYLQGCWDMARACVRLEKERTETTMRAFDPCI